MNRLKVQELADKFIQENNPTGWFEELYSQAKGDSQQIPWADLTVNHNNLTESLKINQIQGKGILLIICRGREVEEEIKNLPYPLTKKELSFFEELGLNKITFEDYLESENQTVRRFRIQYSKVI